MKTLPLILLLAGVVLVLSNGNICPNTKEEPDLGDIIDGDLDLVEMEMGRLRDDMEALVSRLEQEAEADAAGGDGKDAENEALFEKLRDLAEGDGGKELFEYLQTLNEELEKAGVKAFGDLEEGSYRRGGDGEWVVDALQEDIEACKTELTLQESEAISRADTKGREGAAPVEGMGLRGNQEGAQQKIRDMKLQGHYNGKQYKEGDSSGPKLRESGFSGNPSSKVQPGPKLRDSEPSAEKASGDFQPEPTDCKICDELDQDIKEAEEEGPRLFKELLELNPLVKEEVYYRNGQWRIDVLREDIMACSGEDDQEHGSATCGVDGCESEGPEAEQKEEGEDVKSGGEDRIEKFAQMFGEKTFQENIAEGEEQEGQGGVAAEEAAPASHESSP